MFKVIIAFVFRLYFAVQIHGSVFDSVTKLVDETLVKPRFFSFTANIRNDLIAAAATLWDVRFRRVFGVRLLIDN